MFLTMTKKTSLKDQLARALADYDNLRKRVQRQGEISQRIAGLKLVLKLLPVLDMLVGAQKNLKDKGVEITVNEFKEALTSEGVKEIIVKKGDMFDEDLHEVIGVVEKGAKDGEIIDVSRVGWQYEDGPVIRTAEVVVNRKKKKND